MAGAAIAAIAAFLRISRRVRRRFRGSMILSSSRDKPLLTTAGGVDKTLFAFESEDTAIMRMRDAPGDSREQKMKRARVGVLAVFALLAACKGSLPPPETSADGLVRVPSRAEGGVYRDPDADFTHYKRLMIEPLTSAFVNEWRTQHPNVSDSEVRRIQSETSQIFLQVFTGILVDEGPFELADVR